MDKLEKAIENAKASRMKKYFVWFENVYVYAEDEDEAKKLAIEKIKENPVVDDIQCYENDC
jgi:hypothetical protein